MDWKSLVKAVAPVIGTALGGPIGGLAAKTLSQTLLGKDNSTINEIEQAVKKATPDQLYALKKADNDFKIQMEQLGIDLEKIAADDRANARNREIQLKDNAPKLLAAVIVLGFFGVLATMVMIIIPANAVQPINILLGALTAMLTQVGNYYFGSSAGSARKTELMTKS